MIIGILGLQGCCLPHQQQFASLGVATRRIVYGQDLDGVAGLVMPGGESTTMLKTAPPGLWEAVTAFAAQRPVWGICAGAILMAREVTHPAQRSLDLLDIGVSRNAYGSQIDSFVADVALALDPPVTLPCIFIRAPRILRVGSGVTVCASLRGDAIMVASSRHMATTFHPELTAQPHLHRHFLQIAERHR